MLKTYGLYTKQIEQAKKTGSDDAYGFFVNLLQLPEVNHFALSLIAEKGEKVFVNDVAKTLQLSKKKVLNAYTAYSKKYAREIILTGAEATALIIQRSKIKLLFGYPGTSELALCNAILKTTGLTLINGRGDKESAFMAAGGSLLNPTASAAILHGARGLTNAMGAIADANRNEVGTVYFVGLPSTTSARYLPPHGEHNLIKTIGRFTKFSDEITDVPFSTDTQAMRQKKIKGFIKKITTTITKAQSLPLGPTLIGLPQDIMEQRWIPYKEIASVFFNITEKRLSKNDLIDAATIIQSKKNPLILIDDYIFKIEGAKKALMMFSESIHAPVLQIRYTRGPMLFERFSPVENSFFAGSYDPSNTYHKKLINKADILITVEDRNCYPRIIGSLPSCEKIAITSNPVITRKNNYLSSKDLLLVGNPYSILSTIEKIIKKEINERPTMLRYCKKARESAAIKIQSHTKYDFMRKKLVVLLAQMFINATNPLLVDDSQMFGGLLFEGYDKFPENLRVFGDHGAFIGGGIAYAAGLALSTRKKHRVFCSIGDQSFINATQSLIAVAQEQVPITYIICNNGKSVSLLKQAQSEDNTAFNYGADNFLQNAGNIEYTRISEALGISSFQLKFDPESPDYTIRNPEKRLKRILDTILHSSKPVIIELVLPSHPEAWKGIWTTMGKDQNKK